MKVFLSSTYLDLIEHRKAVVHALRTMGEEVEHMEIFGARDEEPTETSLEELDKCDVLVGVYAYRYGTVPKGTKTSVTEQEYLHASKKGIPILIFVVDENHPWSRKSMDKSLTKVEKFKSKATKEHTPEYFTTPDNLAQKVVSSIGRLAKNLSPRTIPNPSTSIPYSHPKPTGSTLPNQPYFFGREKELAIIADAISPESRTWGALIDGPGGIGKTALAIRAAHLAPSALFKRKIFITAKVRELTPEGEKPLKDFSRDNYFSMLNELALELGEEGIPRLPPDERANPLRMAMAGKKTLIVFDNLETLPEDERTRLFQFLSRLPEGNKAIVTSRRRADVDARVTRLDRLSAGEALQLMEELAKNNPRLAHENEKARRDLYEITNGNPLLIKWVCGQLGRERSAMYTIAESCKFIENAPAGNDPLEYIFGDLLETFTESETKVLAALTYFTQPAKLQWIVDMTALPEKAAETTLEDLADRSILTANIESLQFYLPPLAAQFVRSRRTEIVDQTGDSLANRAYALVSQYGGDDNYTGFIELDREWPSIIAALPRFLAGDRRRFQRLCDGIMYFLNFTGRWDERLWLCDQAEQKALAARDNYSAGTRAFNAGFIYSLRGESKDVLACASRAEKYWETATAHEKALASRLFGLGYELDKNYLAATIAFQKALDLWRGINPESASVAIAINDIAGLEHESKDYDAAERDYSEALRIARKNFDQEGIAIYTGNLAELCLDREKWNDAEELAKSALVLAEKIGRQEETARECRRLAKALLHQSRPLEGYSYARRAVEIFTRLRYRQLLKAQEVLEECETAIQAASKIGSKNP